MVYRAIIADMKPPKNKVIQNKQKSRSVGKRMRSGYINHEPERLGIEQ